MGKEAVIANIAEQLEAVCETIKALSKGMEQDNSVHDTYESMLFDEVKHTQILALELTRVVTEDDSATDEADEPEEEIVDNSEPEGKSEEAEAEGKAEAKEE